MDPKQASQYDRARDETQARSRAGTADNWLPFVLVGFGFVLLIGAAAVYSYELSKAIRQAFVELEQTRTLSDEGRELLAKASELEWSSQHLRSGSNRAELAGHLANFDALVDRYAALRDRLQDSRLALLTDQLGARLRRDRMAVAALLDGQAGAASLQVTPEASAPQLRRALEPLAAVLADANRLQRERVAQLIEKRTWSVYVTLALIAALTLLTTLLAARHFEALKTQDRLRGEVARSRRESDDKSRFLAYVSHEIRTPMNAIFGYSGLLQGLPPDSTERRYVDAIIASARALLVMIDDLLDLSKIEAGRLEIAPQPTQLRELVDGVVELFACQASGRGIILCSELPAKLPAVLLDGNRLRQMLVNLVENALKYTASGEVRIRVNVQPQPQLEDHGRCVVEVVDTGIGVAAADLQVIFEPFRRMGPTGVRRGAGLGLYITRQLAHLMGGSVSVVSRVGAGSTFRVELPDVVLLEETTAPAAAQPMPAGLSPPQPSRVLPRLEALLHGPWPQLRETLTIAEARHFAQQLLALAGSGGGGRLLRYAQRLHRVTEDIDIASLELLLADYPSEVVALRGLAMQENADAA